jgi:hypothetical protein
LSSRFAKLVEAQEKRKAVEPPSSSKLDSPSVQDSASNMDRPSDVDSPVNVDSLVITDSQAVMDSLSTEQPPPLPVDRLSKADRLAIQDGPSTEDNQNILSLIPQVAGHTTLPHTYTDHLARWLSADEQAVYVQLYRLSWGWGKDTCFISNRRLSERSGVPETSMRRAVRKLQSKQLIEKTTRVFGSNTDQGIEYRVFSLDRLTKLDRVANVDSLSNMVPNKEKLLKETSQKGIDASRCPDCMGTGFYYPEGTAKGVKRCEHKKLR